MCVATAHRHKQTHGAYIVTIPFRELQTASLTRQTLNDQRSVHELNGCTFRHGSGTVWRVGQLLVTQVSLSNTPSSSSLRNPVKSTYREFKLDLECCCTNPVKPSTMRNYAG